MTDKPPADMRPIMYAHRVHDLQTICRAFGYALALHGSMRNDLDAIAVPWHRASSPEELVEAVCARMGLTVAEGSPTEKEYGRKVWTLLLAETGFIDFSVLPRGEA